LSEEGQGALSEGSICEHWTDGRCAVDDSHVCRPGSKRCLLAKKIKATAELAERLGYDEDTVRSVVERWLYSDYETLERETGLKKEEIAEIARQNYDEIFRDGLHPFPDKVVCKICGKQLKEITSTHLKTHGVKLSDYITQYGHVPKQVWVSRYREYRRWFQGRPLKILKRDGRVEPYSRSKILLSLNKALRKRPVGRETVESITDDVEMELRLRENREVDVQTIGELLLQKLKDTDDVGYVRFASVFRNVHTADQFLEEVKGFLEEPRPADGKSV